MIRTNRALRLDTQLLSVHVNKVRPGCLDTPCREAAEEGIEYTCLSQQLVRIDTRKHAA